jgi:hypothetical protein
MGTYLSVPFASRKVVHLEPSKQVKEANKLSADVNPQVQHLPLTPIHEEKTDEIEVLEMPHQEVKEQAKEEPKEQKEEKTEEPKEEPKEQKEETREPPKLTIQIPEEPVVPVKAAEPPRRSNRRHRKN